MTANGLEVDTLKEIMKHQKTDLDQVIYLKSVLRKITLFGMINRIIDIRHIEMEKYTKINMAKRYHA